MRAALAAGDRPAAAAALDRIRKQARGESRARPAHRRGRGLGTIRRSDGRRRFRPGIEIVEQAAPEFERSPPSSAACTPSTRRWAAITTVSR